MRRLLANIREDDVRRFLPMRRRDKRGGVDDLVYRPSGEIDCVLTFLL